MQRITGNERRARTIRKRTAAKVDSVRIGRRANSIQTASYKGKRVPVVVSGTGAKRVEVQLRSGQAGGGNRYVSVSRSSIQPASAGEATRRMMAMNKTQRRNTVGRTEHLRRGALSQAVQANIRVTREQQGGRARARRAGILKSKGGSTGRRFIRRVYKRDMRGRFA